jgi:hypothetical protein
LKFQKLENKSIGTQGDTVGQGLNQFYTEWYAPVGRLNHRNTREIQMLYSMLMTSYLVWAVFIDM